MESFSRSRSLSKYSTSKLSSDMAAAMISFRRPPSEVRGADDDDSDQDDRRAGVSKGTSSRKLSHQKSKSLANDKRNNNDDDSKVYYEPVTIPKFHEVHTAWPGFDHEPVENWREKYMIAKPYPRNEADVSSKSSYMNYGNDVTILKSNDTHLGLRNCKTKSKGHVSGAKQNKDNMKKTTNKPKRIIYLERVGSCIK